MHYHDSNGTFSIELSMWRIDFIKIQTVIQKSFGTPWNFVPPGWSLNGNENCVNIV